jgi:YidC/Oxa1 family membrane protein insertase
MNILSEIFKPLFELIAGIITFWYAIIPSYGIAISLLTVTVMVAISPLTIKSTKSMLQMQALQPKLKELQKQYGKEDRAALAQAQAALFKEHGVSPAGGCLPMLLQFPLLFVMYDVIRGLTNTVKTKHGVVASPKYILHSSLLYKNLVADHGVMRFLGLNLDVTPLHFHAGFFSALPYYLIVILAVGLQYIQMHQIMSKNPSAASANPSAARLQQSTTLLFGFIYLDVPAGVALYFVVSGLFRIAQQELMWRHDPVLRAHSVEARRKASEAASSRIVEAGSKAGFSGWLSGIFGRKLSVAAKEIEQDYKASQPSQRNANRQKKRKRRRK